MSISWISMSIQPRTAIRQVIEVQPRYGVFYLASFYVLQGIFLAANYWSLGYLYSSKGIILTSIGMAPIAAALWLGYVGWLFKITGRWFGGVASTGNLRYAVAWSKIPFLLFIPIWIYLFVCNSDTTFILGPKAPSALILTSISLALGVWSQILRIQAIREVQSFSLPRSVLNVVVCNFLSSLILFFLFAFVRFIYIYF